MKSEKRIVLVDDHVIVRSGLKELIEQLGPYRVVRQFDSGMDLLQALPVEPEPDLIIMDINMPGMQGDEAVQKLNERGIKIPVLILTLGDQEVLVIKLFRLGIRGYLQKNCSAATMKEALQDIFERGYYHNEFLTYSLKNQEPAPQKDPREQVLEDLSPREREFLKWVCHEKEYTYEQIADKMNVQPRTVDGYRESIFDKFDVKSKTGLVLFVLKHRLFDLL